MNHPSASIGYDLAADAQNDFLRSGGALKLALLEKYRTGELSKNVEFREFPKAMNLSLGIREAERDTETVKGNTIRWIERKETIAPLIVQDEREEAEVRAAFERAEAMGIVDEIDPEWTAQQFLGIIAQRAKAQTRPPTAEERKAARIAELRAELAALDGEPPAPPAEAAQPVRRPHRRTHPVPEPAAGEALDAPMGEAPSSMADAA